MLVTVGRTGKALTDRFRTFAEAFGVMNPILRLKPSNQTSRKVKGDVFESFMGSSLDESAGSFDAIERLSKHRGLCDKTIRRDHRSDFQIVRSASECKELESRISHATSGIENGRTIFLETLDCQGFLQ